MNNLRFAIFGTGFWSRFQLAAWQELKGVACVALYNRTLSKAEALAREFGVPAVYDDPEELLRRERIDFVDVITSVETHRQFVDMAAAHNLPAICQKPMAPSLPEAEAMVAACRESGVPFYVHENWRWQTPIREVKRVLEEGRIATDGPPRQVFRRGSDLRRWGLALPGPAALARTLSQDVEGFPTDLLTVEEVVEAVWSRLRGKVQP